MNDSSRIDTATTPMRARLRAFAARGILDAAEEVFAEQGPQAGMDAIAARAGVAVGTLYKHFADRDGLVQALLEDRFAALLRAMEQAASVEAPTFQAQLEGVLAAVIEVMQRHAGFRRTTLQVELPMNHPRRVALRGEVLERLDRVLDRGRREGLLRDDAEGQLPLLLLGLLHSTMVLSTPPLGRPSHVVAQAVVRQFLYGATAR